MPIESVPAVEFRATSKRYSHNSVPALDALNLRIDAGQLVALLGTSGSGKTTALKLINRMEEPSSGEIFIDGVPAASHDPIELRRRIGYVIQEGGLFPHWTVAENVALVPRMLRWSEDAIQARCWAAMEQARISPREFADRYPATLSGGQRQRVAVARALAAEPKLLLLDEPFSALDPITRDSLHDELKSVVREIRATTILVTHDVTEAFKLGDRVALLDKGRLVQYGTPAQLILTPANDFVREFLRQQRFDLKLRHLPLEGLSPFLPRNRSDNSVPLELSGRQTLADALNVIASEGSESFVVRSDEGSVYGPFLRRDVWDLLREPQR